MIKLKVKRGCRVCDSLVSVYGNAKGASNARTLKK